MAFAWPCTLATSLTDVVGECAYRDNTEVTCGPVLYPAAAVCRRNAELRYELSPRDSFIMRPSSLGGGRILRRTLCVCLSVRLSVRPVIVAMGDVFSAPLASRRAT